MNERQDARAWAEAEFGAAPLPDRRLRERLVDAAASLARRPDGSLPQHFNWAELKGLYRLVHKAADAPEALQQAHRDRTRARMTRPGPVLIIHDGTQLDFTDHAAVRERLGPVGDDGGCGFIQHNSLAVDPSGLSTFVAPLTSAPWCICPRAILPRRSIVSRASCTPVSRPTWPP